MEKLEFKTPQMLMQWMRSNIKYKDFDRLMTSDELIKSKKGSCHDQAYFIYHQLKKMYKPCGMLFFIEYKEGQNQGGMTHTLTWFNTRGKIYWIENAWGGQEGIHGPFNDIKSLKEKIKELHDKIPSSKKFPDLEFRAIQSMKYGCTLNELVNSILSEDTVLLLKESQSILDKYDRIEITKSNVDKYKKYKWLKDFDPLYLNHYFIWLDHENLVCTVGTYYNETYKNNLIFGLEVEPKYRRMGLSQDILNFIINNYNVNMLEVEENNNKAINAYKKYGFTIISEKKTIDGRDMYLMQFNTNLNEESSKGKDMYYGLPKVKKFPLYDAKHVRLAVKFFNYAKGDEEKELCNAIIKRAKELNVTNIKIPSNSKLRKYIDPTESEAQLIFLASEDTEITYMDYDIDTLAKKVTPESVDVEKDSKPLEPNAIKTDLANNKNITEIKLDSLPDKLFITSDIHLFRNETQTETPKFIINHINSQVGPDDTLFILGDIGYKRDPALFEHTGMLIKSLNCKHIWLALGNHDTLNIEDYYKLGFEKVAHIFTYGDISFSHYPKTDKKKSIHGHTHLEDFNEYCKRNNIDTKGTTFINVYFYSNEGKIYTFKEYMKDNTINEGTLFDVDRNLRRKQLNAAKKAYKTLINKYDFKHLKKGLSRVMFDLDEDRYIQGDINKFQFLKWDLYKYTLRRDDGFTATDKYKNEVEYKLNQLVDELSKELRCKVTWEGLGNSSYIYIYAPEHAFNESNIIQEMRLETFLAAPNLPKHVVLFHGSSRDKLLSYIEPFSVNYGTKLSHSRSSSFWTTEFQEAVLMAIIGRLWDNSIKTFFTLPYSNKSHVVIKKSDNDKVVKILKRSKFYVYKKTVDRNILGAGHDSSINEFTIDIPVKPDSYFILTYDQIKSAIVSVDDDKFDSIKYYQFDNVKMRNTLINNKSLIPRSLIYKDKRELNKMRNDERKLMSIAANESTIAGLAPNVSGPGLPYKDPEYETKLVHSGFQDYDLPSPDFLYEEMDYLIKNNQSSITLNESYGLFTNLEMTEDEGLREYNLDLWNESGNNILYIINNPQFKDSLGKRIAEKTNSIYLSLEDIIFSVLSDEKVVNTLKSGDYIPSIKFYTYLHMYIREHFGGKKYILEGIELLWFGLDALKNRPLIIQDRDLSELAYNKLIEDNKRKVINNNFESSHDVSNYYNQFISSLDQYNIFDDKEKVMKLIKLVYVPCTTQEYNDAIANYVYTKDISDDLDNHNYVFLTFNGLYKWVNDNPQLNKTHFMLVPLTYIDEYISQESEINQYYRALEVLPMLTFSMKNVRTEELESFNNFLSETSFNIDADGTMIIGLREKTDFMAKFNLSHRLIKIYKKAKNIEAIKHELCKLWMMYIIIEKYYINPKREPNNAKYKELKKEAIKAKGFILNEFYSGLEFVLSIDNKFDFSKYFAESPYYKDAIKISVDNIKGMKKIIQAIMA